MGPTVEKKAAIMAKKTEEVRRMFNLTETEYVIQTYQCSMGIKKGTVAILLNYIAFFCGFPKTQESYPLRKITGMKKTRSVGVPNSITIQIESGENIKFSAFTLSHREEAFLLMEHLWKNPPSYVGIPKNLPQQNNNNAEANISNVQNPENQENTNNPFANQGNTSGAFQNNRQESKQIDAFSDFNGSGGSFQGQSVKVDTAASKEALRIAMEAHEMGAATLNELAYQGEVIDVIERDVESIHSDLEKANKHLNGIGSFAGAVGNKLSSGPTRSDGLEYKDRTILVGDRVEGPVDINILIKLKNDSLQIAVMRLEKDDFSILNEQGSLIKNIPKRKYENIKEITMRARHMHVDIRFSEKKKDRIRLMSSYIQGIVNELSLRTNEDQVKISFEPGVKIFDYGSPFIRNQTIGVSKPEPSSGGFKRANKIIPTGPSQEILLAPEEHRNALLEQDNDIDQISNIVGDIGSMALSMGTEIDRQTEQLVHVHGRVDEANEKMHNTNKKVGQFL